MDNLETKNKKTNFKKIFLHLFIILLIITLIILYARFLAIKDIQINEIKILNTNLTDDYKGFKIVHISDILYKNTTTKKDLNELKEKVNLTKPDIIVITGDLLSKKIDYTDEDINDLKSFLNEINASVGKYIISGDNDDINELTTIINDTEFIILDDTYDTIYKNNSNYLFIAGISSNDKDINEKLTTINEFLENNTPIYKILIFHKPDLIDEINTDKYDLILAGHSLLGNIRIPYIGSIIKKEGARKYSNNYYKINTSLFYISNGIGNDDIYFRLFNKPSFNLYRLTNKQ